MKTKAILGVSKHIITFLNNLAYGWTQIKLIKKIKLNISL